MSGAIAGNRILIVEDEYFIALEIQRALNAVGAEVLGPVPSLEKASIILDSAVPDFAILDVNLEGESSFPIADRLKDSAIPFMFVTGYDDWVIADRYRDVPRMTKPYSIGSLIAFVVGLVDA